MREFQKKQADTYVMIAELTIGQNVKAAPKKKWLNAQNNLQPVVLFYQTYKNKDRNLQDLENVANCIHL